MAVGSVRGAECSVSPPRRPHPTRRPLRHTWARTGCAPARPPTLTPRLPSVCTVQSPAALVCQCYKCTNVCVCVCVRACNAKQLYKPWPKQNYMQPRRPGQVCQEGTALFSRSHGAAGAPAPGGEAGVAERAFSQSAYLFLFMAQRAVSAGTATSQPTARASLTLEHSTFSVSRSEEFLTANVGAWYPQPPRLLPTCLCAPPPGPGAASSGHAVGSPAAWF